METMGRICQVVVQMAYGNTGEAGAEGAEQRQQSCVCERRISLSALSHSFSCFPCLWRYGISISSVAVLLLILLLLQLLVPRFLNDGLVLCSS